MRQGGTPRDRALVEDVLDVLEHDRRTRELDLDVDVRGGVAHVHGTVPSDDARWLVRRVVGRVRGIHAVWDVLRTSADERLRALDLGCGGTKQHAWAIGVDRFSLPAVDVIADVERGLPFADDSVDQVFTVHFLEHVHDVVTVMNEIHRVLKPTGVVHAMAPNWQFVNAVADPTHVRFFHVQTFKYFCRPGPGVRSFWPLAVSASVDNVYADLRPVKDGGPHPTDDVLARYFD